MSDARLPVVRLRHDQLQVNALQNAARCTPAAIKQLAMDVEKSGWIYPILVCQPNTDGKYPIATGHRRLEVSKLRGETEIDCILSPESDPTMAFVADASGSRAVTGRDFLVMWANDLAAYACFPPSVQKKIKDLCNWVGARELKRLVLEQGLAPSMVGEIERCVKIIAGYHDLPGSPYAFRGDALYWMLKHKQTQAVRAAKRGVGKGLATRLLKSIINDKPLAAATTEG